LLPEPLTAEIDAALLDAQSVLHSFGVTGWQDAIVGSYLGRPDPFEAYLRAANSGALSARVVGALWWDRTRGLEQVDELLERRERARAGRFRAGTVKIMQDGIAETGTAALLGPYLDACGCVTANSGESFIDPVALNGYVRELDRLGFQLHFHALGDRAVREALDALEAAAEANGPRERRHHLAHLQVVDPGDIPRFAALGAIANLQTLWATHDVEMDELTIPFLGPERSRLQYPFASLLRAGATLAAGSDWPVSSPDPLAAIHVAVNRIGPGSGAAAFLPDQAIGLAAAFRAYTRGSAHVNGDDEGGVIQAGAPADLVLLDRDPFAGPAGEIAATRALATYVGGHRVFAADAF
jgi:predicted amidohydrolase YtcJ